MPSNIELSILFYKEGETWVAQGLEYDVAAFSDSMDTLIGAFERAVAANLCVNADLGRQGLEGIPPAPEKFRAMFESSNFDMTPRQIAHTDLPVQIGASRFAEAA